MSDAWRDFLSSAGAEFAGGTVMHFSAPESERNALRGSVIADLGHLGLVSVSGEDAKSFLQGQLSCDMNRLDPGRSLPGAWCSPKGRVLTVLQVVSRGEAILLQMQRDRLEETLSRLGLYVLRARVRLENASGRFVRIGLCGEDAAALLGAAFGDPPVEADAVVEGGGATMLRLRGPGPRFEVLFEDVDAARDFWSRATQTMTPVGAESWDLLDILAGVPTAITADEYLPQMLNLDQIGAVSFTKGCYVGQEIIARAQHLGRVKRRMFQAYIDGDQAPPQHAPLYREGSGDEADGRLLVARPRPEGGHAALAVIKLESAELPLRLGAADGPTVTVAPPPYARAGDQRSA
ncbi:MAG: folate-binding protein [Gammaproteobacteria bacterium]|nr:folate-binding protein [Gammaproteobacteria bacterium]